MQRILHCGLLMAQFATMSKCWKMGSFIGQGTANSPTYGRNYHLFLSLVWQGSKCGQEQEGFCVSTIATTWGG
jgi:hypothetical protein